MSTTSSPPRSDPKRQEDPTRRRTPSLVSMFITAALCSLLASSPAAADQAVDCPGSAPRGWNVAMPELDIVHFGTQLGLLCSGPAVLWELELDAETVPMTCDFTSCSSAAPLVPAYYQLEDIDGRAVSALKVVEGGKQFGHLRSGAKIAAGRRVTLSARRELVKRPEEGFCHSLPPGEALERGRTYLAVGNEALLLVVADQADRLAQLVQSRQGPAPAGAQGPHEPAEAVHGNHAVVGHAAQTGQPRQAGQRQRQGQERVQVCHVSQ